MGAADAGQQGRDMAVLAVEGQGPLGDIPGERRKATLDRGDSARLAIRALPAGGERSRRAGVGPGSLDERLEL